MIFYPGSVITVSAAILAVPFGQNAVIAGARNWALWHRWCARHLLGIRVNVIGEISQDQALYVFKHESMFETIETLVLFDRPVVVMKRELVDMFGWGYVARAQGVIPVDRDAGGAAMRRMIAAAKIAKDSGRPIVLFPEGTRVPHGEQPELRAGFAGLYKILGLTVIPVAVDSGKIWPRAFIKRSGIVTMQVGAPIPPGLPRDEVEPRVHKAINALNETLFVSD